MTITPEIGHSVLMETAKLEIARFTAEAQAEAHERILRFNETLIPRLVQAHLLEALANPSFQRSVGHAQLEAACADRETDSELLTSLLMGRATRDVRQSRIAIDKAVSVVASLDDAALQTLTLAMETMNAHPAADDLDGKLQALEEVAQGLVGTEGFLADWRSLHGLVVADCIRVHYVGEPNLIRFWQLVGPRLRTQAHELVSRVPDFPLVQRWQQWWDSGRKAFEPTLAGAAIYRCNRDRLLGGDGISLSDYLDSYNVND